MVYKKMIDEIKSAVNKGMALGSNEFKEQIELSYSRRVRPASAGRRPRKVR